MKNGNQIAENYQQNIYKDEKEHLVLHKVKLH